MNDCVLIEGIKVHVNGILSITHSCEPYFCKAEKCCCSSYEVCIDQQELSAITGYMPIAAKFSSNLKFKNQFNNVFQEIEQNLMSIDTDENELCVFAYSNIKNHILCSLHSASISMEVNSAFVKPKSCTLWPLSLIESKPNILTISEEAFSFTCNKLRKENRSTIDKGISLIIQNIFGINFLKALENEIKSVN